MNFFKKFLFIALLTFSLGNNTIDAKIKLYSFYTDSHEVLKNDWFEPSIQDDFEVIIRHYPQECPAGSYYSPGWNISTGRKVEMILDAIEENWGEWFIYADIDIQFFRPMQEDLEALMGDYDMIIQKDSPSGIICTGFLACRANEKTRLLWQQVQYNIREKNQDDQVAMNEVVRRPELNIKWAYLPNRYLSGGTLTGKRWSPGEDLPIPADIILHHANWTIGVENKIKQLQYVKNKMYNLNI